MLPLQEITFVKLQGGLGNQLFQAAVGMAVSTRTGNRLFFDVSTYPSEKKRGYELDNFPHGAELCVIRTVAEDWPGTHFHETGLHYDKRIEALTGDVFLVGYFQSAHYFSAIAGKVRETFDLAPQVGPAILEQGRALAENPAVSVHVRRGDYLTPHIKAFHGNLDQTYYASAVSLIRRISPQIPLLVFSDEPEDAHFLFDGMKHVRFVSGNSHFEDMYLMQCCRHHIIANSSFSWWGAWLGQHADTMTIAPRNWFSRETMLTNYSGDICPEGWILL